MSAPASTLGVIIVCKNPGPSLLVALESIWAQRAVAPEIIVIDGASTDGTLARLEAHRSKISAFISEPDSGVYEAMNKGIARARAEWLYFLGADDRLAGDRVLSEMLDRAQRTNASVLAGEVAFDDGRIYRLSLGRSPLIRNFLHHQGAFYRRALFADIGAFDTSLAVMGDYDFNLRLWQRGGIFESVPLRVAECATQGLSDSGHWRGYHEEIAVRHRYGSALRCWCWDALSLARWVRKSTLRLVLHHHG